MRFLCWVQHCVDKKNAGVRHICAAHQHDGACIFYTLLRPITSPRSAAMVLQSAAMRAATVSQRTLDIGDADDFALFTDEIAVFDERVDIGGVDLALLVVPQLNALFCFVGGVSESG